MEIKLSLFNKENSSRIKGWICIELGHVKLP